MLASPSPRPPRLRRFRVDVGTIISVVVLLQSVLLLGLGYWGSQRLVTAIGESAHRADHLRVEDKINAFLGKAISVVSAIATAPSLRPAGDEAEQTAELLWVLLQQSPELDSVYVANDAGRMLMVQRYPEPAVRHIHRSGNATRETWELKPTDSEGDIQQRYRTTEVRTFRSNYNPLGRTWFLDAMRTGGPIWTEPYIFSAAQELGVTYAIPGLRRDGSGAQMIVASGDVTLGRLSDFVRQFSRAGYGDSALISEDDRVLARSDVPGRTRSLEAPTGGVLGEIHAHMVADGSVKGTARVHFPVTWEGQRFLVQASRIPATNWRLISWVPEDQLLGELRRTLLMSLAIVVGFLMFVLLFAQRLAKRVTRPVEQLSEIARRIGRLELDVLPRVKSRVLELQHLDQALNESARGLKAFRRFVPVDVVQQLLAEGRPLTPSGEPREVTVMFTDINGFTALAESTPPDQLVEQLTQYFNVASEVIAAHGGTIDKFIGDGMMVLWGAPTDVPDAPYKACRAALALLDAVQTLNAEWSERGMSTFDTRIGIHTGPVVAGVLGAEDRLAYTAVGDTVNVASRLEGINRDLGTRVVISDTTATALRGRLTLRRLEDVELRGRLRRVTVYELLPGTPQKP